jgi:glutamate dehydrogenase/leucine dehydrogenase
MDIFENIKKSLEKVSIFMNLSEKETELLLTHKWVNKAEIAVNGKKYDAWRIVHNNSLGPGKGGIRYHPDVSEDEVKSLSFWMSLKNSLAGLPYGGGKGGIRFNPKEASEKEIEEISRQYIRKFHNNLGEDIDVPAPDVYTNSKIMGFMLDEFEKIKGYHEPGFITGKPIELGGIKIRGDSTSKGGFIVLKKFLLRMNIDKSKVKIAIQGFGNAGNNIAKMLYDEEFKIIAVSDSKGGIIDENGLDIIKIKKLKDDGKSVQDCDYSKITNEELLELDCDILILAALENQITSENADKVKCKCILELANGPVSFDADSILSKKGIIVIPDILANSGGVVVSYFEWCQNKVGNLFEEDFLIKKLEEIMSNSFNKVYELWLQNKEMLDMRSCAYVIAIKRILEAERARGNL